MAAADSPNSVPASQIEQLTAPPGWTKKLVPAKGKYITLRKHDVVFIAPDGQELPSQWHLRRYLKAHPEAPAFSDFSWSSGEESSVRRSGRASTKEISYSERKSRGKRNASDMDVEETEDGQVKTPARKRAKKAEKEGSSVVKDNVLFPVMPEVSEVQVVDGKADDDTALGAAVQNDQVDAGNGKVLDTAMEEQVEAENAVKATDGATREELNIEEVAEQVLEVKEHVVDSKEHVELEKQLEEVVTTSFKLQEVKEHVEGEKHVVTTSIELQKEAEPKGVSGVSPLDAPSNELKNQELVVESEPFDASVVESKKPLDQKLEVEEKLHKVIEETHVMEELHESEKISLEPLMQKEELERLPSGDNSSLKVEHIKERSPNELSSSPLPVNVAIQ